jgi:hypothetical protein
MKNLFLLQQTLHKLDFVEQGDVVIGYTSVDKNTYYGITQNGILFTVDMFSYEATLKSSLKTDFSNVVHNDAQMIGIQFVSELEALCIVSNLGNIVTYRIFTDEVCVCKISDSIVNILTQQQLV